MAYPSQALLVNAIRPDSLSTDGVEKNLGSHIRIRNKMRAGHEQIFVVSLSGVSDATDTDLSTEFHGVCPSPFAMCLATSTDWEHRLRLVLLERMEEAQLPECWLRTHVVDQLGYVPGIWPHALRYYTRLVAQEHGWRLEETGNWGTEISEMDDLRVIAY